LYILWQNIDRLYVREGGTIRIFTSGLSMLVKYCTNHPRISQNVIMNVYSYCTQMRQGAVLRR